MEDQRVYQPARLIVGWCPECGRLVVIHNDHEVWPLAKCDCGWVSGTGGLVDQARFERDYSGIKRAQHLDESTVVCETEVSEGR